MSSAQSRLLVFVLILVAKVTAAQPVASVFRVRSSGCPELEKSTLRQQTGFTVAGSAGVYTALHGVLGCNDIKVIDEQAKSYGPLTLVQVDVSRDVALLTGVSLPQSAGLSAPSAGTAVRSGDSLTVNGYPLGLSGQLVTHLEARAPTSVVLRGLVPPAILLALQARKSPDLDQFVYSVEGHLLPGHSGAPVRNKSGQVVGIANGGLEKGAVEISWVIPWKDIDLTPAAKAQDNLDRVTKFGALGLFAIESTPPTATATATCFGQILHPVKILGLNELVATVDDPGTYQAIVQSYGLVDSVESFTVYRSSAGEVTLVVPGGWTLTSLASGACKAVSPVQGIELNYELFSPVGPSRFVSLNNQVLQREFDLFCSRSYIVDPTYSNWIARPVLSRGILAQRRTLIKIDRKCQPPRQFGAPPEPWNGQVPSTYSAIQVVPRIRPVGYLQCQPLNCTDGFYAYPDVWAPFGAVPKFVRAWGFDSVVIAQKRALFSWMDWTNPAMAGELAECVQTLSTSPACETRYAEQRTWAVGVIAATSSAVSK